MPVVAVLADTRVEAWALDDVGWAELKRRYRSGESLTMVCGRPGVPKRSPRGLRFFAHKAGEDCRIHATAPESAEHSETKRLVAEAARGAGWTATVEAPAADRSWIADVLLEKDGRRVVVEAQWATEAQLRERTERYLADRIDRVLWLLGPKNHTRASEIDAELVRGEPGFLEVLLPGPFGDRPKWRPLADGFADRLDGQYRSEVELAAIAAYVAVRQVRCWVASCNQWLTRWHIVSVEARSRCGGEGVVELAGGHYPAWAKRRPETSIQSIMLPALSRADLARPAGYAWRKSRTVPDGYVAQLCPYCGMLQGDAFSDGRWTHYRVEFEAPTRFPFGRDVTAIDHLCLNIGAGRCVPSIDAPETTWEGYDASSGWAGGSMDLGAAPEMLAPPNADSDVRKRRRSTAP